MGVWNLVALAQAPQCLLSWLVTEASSRLSGFNGINKVIRRTSSGLISKHYACSKWTFVLEPGKLRHGTGGRGSFREKREVQSGWASTVTLWRASERLLTRRKKIKAKLFFSESALGGLEFWVLIRQAQRHCTAETLVSPWPLKRVDLAGLQVNCRGGGGEDSWPSALTLFLNFFFSFLFKIVLPACNCTTCIHVGPVEARGGCQGPLELEGQLVVCRHVGARNQTQVLLVKNS